MSNPKPRVVTCCLLLAALGAASGGCAMTGGAADDAAVRDVVSARDTSAVLRDGATDVPAALDAATVPDAANPPTDAARTARDAATAHDASSADAAHPADAGACFDALAHPSRCGYPDATNTGVPAGTHLTPSGDLTISTPGAVVSGLDVTGTVTIAANNVTFRNSVVHAQGYWGIYVPYAGGYTGIVIDHVEVDGGRSSPSVAGVVGSNLTLRAANIHGTGDAVDIGDDDTVVDCWIHDLFVAPGDHTDGIQSTGGGPSTIQHNTIDARCTGCNSAVIMGADLGDIRSITLADNLFAGGNFTAYAGANPGHDSGTIVFTGNRFTAFYQYGPCSFRPSSGRTVGFTGNTWDADGTPVTGCD